MMIAQLVRPVWEWVLWSRRRLAVTVCILALLVIVTGRVAQAQHNQPAPQASPPATAHPSPPGQVSAPPATGPAPDAPAPVPSGSGLGGALVAGQQFAAAWVTHAPGWQAQARRYATATLAAGLGKPTGGHSRAAAITGPAAVAGEAAGTVTVTVPTTAGAAVITVVHSAGRWLAAAARYAPTGR
jgi:hypothetical protein